MGRVGLIGAMGFAADAFAAPLILGDVAFKVHASTFCFLAAILCYEVLYQRGR